VNKAEQERRRRKKEEKRQEKRQEKEEALAVRAVNPREFLFCGWGKGKGGLTCRQITGIRTGMGRFFGMRW